MSILNALFTPSVKVAIALSRLVDPTNRKQRKPSERRSGRDRRAKARV